MNNKLTEKLKEIQLSLSERKEAGIARLEILADEARAAFEEAIDGLREKINIREELRNRREALKKWRRGILKTIFPVNWNYVISAPFIYMMIAPIVLLHVFLEIYQQICFRLYGIPLVKQKEYFVYDRHLLPYLNWIEKINCLYCSYGNNVFRYATEITARTERYWCPIKYASKVKNPHSQYDKFVDILDAENFRAKWSDLRNFSDIDKCEENNCDFIKKKESERDNKF